MGDKDLKELLKWSIENSSSSGAAATSEGGDASQQQQQTLTPLNPELLKALFGGPSDAELMQAAMVNITSTDPEITLESKLTAFDNLEQLIESLDNANLLSKLGLWTPLLELLGHDEPQIRLMAAWVIGTAVQNNEPCQERLVALGGVKRLAAVAMGDRVAMEKRAGDGDVMDDKGNAGEKEGKDVRRKAVYALSSACRNYQPAMDVLTAELAKRDGSDVPTAKIDATDMEAVNTIIDGLREKAANA
jgi:hsp70-interacting protein